ncbi:serine/threonine-protein kinase [Nocardia sp. CC227C]|uniref:serine/threonine-protein kinase n=1 Tax=Nocardia sp. CC227C TaxID=3044562 RepID=UPI00278C66A9|nr:serine/threonine-protein kinase [Nocardia sp. CC227C]
MKGLSSNDPRRLGRNRLIAVIGQGGMGRVLLGQAPSGRLLAVKQIHRPLARNTEFRERFRREVTASAQVTGAYTAAVVDSDTESERPWLATEYIPGPDLRTVIEETGPLSLGGMRLLAAGLAAALIEIHRAGLVHRDLKPANVLLTVDGPRVIDFGIARALEGDAQLTATGSVVGSPAYMSPEQAQGQPLGPAADVFSVGAILAMAATGDSPFSGTATPQVLYSVIHSAPDVSRVPPPLRDIVEHCLAKDPAQRPTPEQLLEAAGRIEAEPVWPGAVRDLVAGHRADSQWWTETTAKHARYEAQLADLRDRRRRTLRTAAAAVGALVFVAGTAFAAQEWAEQPGHAAPASDLSMAVTGEQWRTLDICALLENSLSPEFGARTGDFSNAILNSCGTTFTDSSGTEVAFELEIGSDDVMNDNLWKPSGEVAGWMPMFGLFTNERSCARTVVTQNRPLVSVELTAKTSETSGNGCPVAERGLRAVVNRLAVNPPRLSLPENSIRPLDPCALLDENLVSELVGPSVRRTVRPTSCHWSGDDYNLTLTLNEHVRPDRNSRNSAVQVDGATAYLQDSGGRICDLAYMARPTHDDQAEVVTISMGAWRDGVPDTCDRAERALSAVLPGLPK